jgi:DNA polymerase elongation subunit (family B)
LLERWYAERQDMQVKKKEAVTDEDTAFWDKRQLVKKINLNSLYGAILNPGCRFYDKRIGQSTTLTGRCITRHMGSKTNEVIAGEYDYKGESIIYGDTDSIYFSMYPVYKDKIDSGEIAWSKEIVIDLYDEIAKQVNVSFPDFMKSFFHVPRKQGEIIRAGRENAATMGIFIKKKRYAMLIYDDDGERKDVNGLPGKVKAMGLDLKRSDTPVFMQDFLKNVLMTLLTDGTSEEVIGMIKGFKKEFRKMPPWLKGTPKRVNNLTNHTKIFEKTGKCGVGHALAAINWNRLRKMNSDGYSMEISDGMKTIVCKLKPNPMDITSIAYPIDELKIPQWFQDLPFDNDLMEHTIITKKINNLVGVLNWDLNDTNNSETFDNLFEF